MRLNLKSAFVLSLLGLTNTSFAEEPKVKVSDSSFKCIQDMTKVRGFYVDNLMGPKALKETLN